MSHSSTLSISSSLPALGIFGSPEDPIFTVAQNSHYGHKEISASYQQALKECSFSGVEATLTLVALASLAVLVAIIVASTGCYSFEAIPVIGGAMTSSIGRVCIPAISALCAVGFFALAVILRKNRVNAIHLLYREISMDVLKSVEERNASLSVSLERKEEDIRHLREKREGSAPAQNVTFAAPQEESK